jgi:hypothetical protein
MKNRSYRFRLPGIGKVGTIGVLTVVALHEGVPHEAGLYDCILGADVNLCSVNANLLAVESPNFHVPHRDYETGSRRSVGWIASGQASSSTSTSPTYRWTLAGGVGETRG